MLACRDRTRADAAANRIRAAAPRAEIATQELDLASLSSVRTAAEALRARYPRIDILINNAGVMWQPSARTADGFETHLGVNHLGHFAFTGSSASTVSLAAHPGGARSELNRNMPAIFRGRFWGPALLITHSVEKGALPVLRAATDPSAVGGQYYGPDGWNEFKGHPTVVRSTDLSHDTEIQRRLWHESERLTRVSYSFPNLAEDIP